MLSDIFGPPPIKRRVFVSYHHAGDQAYYDQFSLVFSDVYETIYDNSLERKIDSDASEYVIRQIREKYITGSSCTIVLVGKDTWRRKFVDWEIAATLDKAHGLIGIQLPTLPVINNTVSAPDRLHANIKSGYAVWKHWNALVSSPQLLGQWIEEANSQSSNLIQNSQQRRVQNS